MMANAAVDPSRPFLRARASARRTLLEAARRITAHSGVDAVSLGNVADEAGFARTTAYAHFCSRDELLQAVVADDLSALLRAMRTTMGLPEPPPNPLPPTRVVRTEFERAPTDSDAITAVQDIHAETAPVDIVHLKFFRTPSNDRFDDPSSQVAEWDRSDSLDGDTDLSSTAGTATVTEMQSFSKRLEAFEKKHEQTVLEMMAEIRAIAQKIEGRQSTEGLEAPTVPVGIDAVPCEPAPPQQVPDEAFESPALAVSPTPDDASEASLGWTIRFSTDYLSRARRAAVAASPSPRLVVVEPRQPGGRTRRIVVALAVGAIALGSIAIALRSYSTHLPPHATSTAVSRHAAGTHKSVKHVSHADGPVDRLSMKAEAGEPDAELTIGLKYLNGDGATKNEAVGAGWIARSALKGNTLAQYWLATLYEHGRGVATDPVQAFAWYEKAALGGNRKAMHNLAVAYAQGSGVAKDMSEAARWFSRAASLGYVDSAFNLAVLYERGDGVPQSLIDAYKWYAIAGGQGDAESKLRMSAIESELSPEALAAAQKAAATFKGVPDAAEPQSVTSPH